MVLLWVLFRFCDGGPWLDDGLRGGSASSDDEVFILVYLFIALFVFVCIGQGWCRVDSNQ